MVGVAGHAVAGDLGVDRSRRAPRRAPAPRGRGCPRPRRGRSRRGPCRRAARRAAGRRCASTAPASRRTRRRASGVMTASAPPAIIASASPRRMMFARVADRVRRRRAGRRRGRVRALSRPVRIETRPDGHVDDEARDEERADPPGPLLEDVLCVSSMSGRPPIPEPMHTPTRSAFSVVIDEARVGHRLLRRGDGVVDERVELLDFLLLEERCRVEPLHLARDAARVLRGVEAA